MLCILTGGKVIALAVTGFTLSWDHSVQHIEWWERWQVSDRGLRPVEARVTGSGAGIDLPPDAVWKSDGWHYQPRLPWQKSVHLGASGATRGGLDPVPQRRGQAERGCLPDPWRHARGRSATAIGHGLRRRRRPTDRSRTGPIGASEGP